MSSFAFTRSLSEGTRQSNAYYCFCNDCDDGDNDINDVSKFVRLGCTCISHYHCLIQYVRYKLGDRISMSLNGISCPYGSECKSFKTLDEVDGDDTKIYYITTTDLDTIVDYGTNHPKLQQYLDEHECTALTHEEVNGLRLWIEEERERLIVPIDPNVMTDLFIISTTKACPHCGYRSTHYHGHQCHYISPSDPPKRGGCPNCHVNYCYRCLSTEIENKRDRGSDSSCRCGYWSNFCRPITSSSDIKKYIAINAGGIPYDTRCGCVICSDCRYGKSCEYCPGDCCVCKGYVNPSPNEAIDTNDEEKKWKANGPALSSGSSSGMSLWDCCRHGNDDALRQLLESGAVTVEDANRRDGEGRTALYLAVDANHIECIRLLLPLNGIDVNIADRDGWTPLYIACSGGHTDIVRLLLSNGNGIDVNIANRDGYTPLYTACSGGHTDIVRLLLFHNLSNWYGILIVVIAVVVAAFFYPKR